MNRKAYSLNKNWKRVKTASGFRYFNKGKITSADKFQRAAKRIRSEREQKRQADTNKLRRSLKLKPLPKKPKKQQKPKAPPKIGSQANPVAFCKVKDRQEFYERVKADRKALAEKLGDEEADELRIVVDIDPTATKKALKKDKRSRGYRPFKSLKKLKRFLGLDYKYSAETGDLKPPVDWTKKGVCTFEKKANISLIQTRGERIIGRKILKRYAIENP